MKSSKPLKDLTGKVFGKWLVLGRILKEEAFTTPYWNCRCICGTTKLVHQSSLKSGKSKCCGCDRQNDLSGLRFGRLLVKNLNLRRKNCTIWNCLCDCNNKCIVNRSNLLSGKQQSCGCLRKESSQRRKGNLSSRWNPKKSSQDRLDSDNNRKTTSPEYKTWRKSIYEQNNYTCQKCFHNMSGQLEAHHIESWASNEKLRYCLDNGITLCRQCHVNFHKIYGKTNNNRNQIQKYIEKSIE